MSAADAMPRRKLKTNSAATITTNFVAGSRKSINGTAATRKMKIVRSPQPVKTNRR